jgi:hypothetical protein
MWWLASIPLWFLGLYLFATGAGALLYAYSAEARSASKTAWRQTVVAAVCGVLLSAVLLYAAAWIVS